MKPQRRPKEKIDNLPELPIELKPFDAEYKRQAENYCVQLNLLLAPLGVSAELTGSVELEIASKGEWEYGIYLTDEQWFPVLIFLINHFHSIHALMDDFAVFLDRLNGLDIEIFPMRNEAAQRNRAIMDYWRKTPAALKDYEHGKLQHAFSKREYYRWKDEYLARIVERL